MTQSLGQYLVNRLLPENLRSKDTLDKKALHERLYQYARSNPGDAAKTIDGIRELGHEIATTEGASLGLDDITPDYKRRAGILRPVLRQLQAKPNLSENERGKLILEGQAKLQDTLKKGFHGSQDVLVRSGARGKPVQLMRSFMAPVAARKISGDPVPWLIHHSYSEGLRPSEAFATNIETRNNIISANLAVTEPGDFSKILVNNMGDELVLSEDCGTTNGVSMDPRDPNVIDRHLARAAGGHRANALITPQVASDLVKKKTRSIMVRSPMTCELNAGVCQKCFGQDEKGQHHSLGTNVGIRSAQAITEPLTQFTLSAKHGVRQAGDDKAAVQGLKGLRQFLEMPKSFANKATLSTVRGKVERVQKAPQGGYNIKIGDNEFYTPPHLKPTVRPGEKVTPGDALSDGVPMANEVVRYKGLGAGRKYMVEQLHDTYRRQGVDLDKRHFEILARKHLNHVEVEEDPEENFYPGEVVSFPTMMSHLAQQGEDIPTTKAENRLLAKNYLHHTAGTIVSPEMVRELKNEGVKSVRVAKNPPKVSFIVQPITSNPLLNPDWMARMGHRKLKTTLLEAAHQGQKADIHGASPIPAYAYGSEFGEGPGHRY